MASLGIKVALYHEHNRNSRIIIVSLCHEWRRAGLLHGNLTCDAFLAFLSQILHTVQQTD